MAVLVPLLAFLATSLQTYTSAKELGAARKPEVEWWNTEDELIEEIPSWRPIKRFRTRRVLVKMRPEDVHMVIRHMELVLLGWVLLDAAALLAVANVIVAWP